VKQHLRVRVLIGVSLSLVLVAAALTAALGPPSAPNSALGMHKPARHDVDRASGQGAASLVKASVAVAHGKMPLTFIENRGQVDARVAYYIQGADKTLYFTPEGITFVLTGKANRRHASSRENSFLHPVALTSDEPQNDVQPSVLKLDFIGARPGVSPVGRDVTSGVVSYFKGPRNQWKTGLKTFGTVAYPDLWPGIDLVYSGTMHQLKYTFMVKPGADPTQIKLAYRGATAVTVTKGGLLEVSTPAGGFHDEKPYAYQQVDEEERVEVATAYALQVDAVARSHVYGFRVGNYDKSKPLVLDPAVLVYAGYIGGAAADSGSGIAVDNAGNAYIVGSTSSTELTFPEVVGPDLTYNGNLDAFVVKVNSAGTELSYASYIGGINDDKGFGVAVDSAGEAYITGVTNSTEGSFPVIVGPDLTFNGSGDIPTLNRGSVGDTFVAKVNAAGTALVYAGYIGSNGSEDGLGIAVDSLGNAYVIGEVVGNRFLPPNFPVTVGPQLSNHGFGFDAYVAKVNPTGTALVYCGYISSNGHETGTSIAVDNAGNAYVAGRIQNPSAALGLGETFPVTVGPDLTFRGEIAAFVGKVNAAGTGFDYLGYITAIFDVIGEGIAIDNVGNAYVAGWLDDTRNFPATVGPDLSGNGGIDAFVAKVNAQGTGLVYAGFIGGFAHDFALDIAVDSDGSAFVTGQTQSTETTPFECCPAFPVGGGPDLTHNGDYDAFIAKVKADGTALEYAGYIGGVLGDHGNGVALGPAGSVYIVGFTLSSEASFPEITGPDLTYNGGGDAFVAKITENRPPTANGGGPYTVGEGGSVGLAGSGGDPDNDPLTYTWDLDNNSTFETPGQNPNFSAAGRDGPSSQTIVLRVCDDKNACATSSATVNITNVPPTANPDVASTNEDTAVTVNVLANDTDVPGDPLTVTSVSSPSVNGGTVVNNGNGTVTYTPPANFGGTDSFTYTISDGDGGTAGANVTITVNAVNDAPVNTVPGPQGTARNLPLLFSQAGGNPISIADIDAGTAAVRVTLTASNGTITLNPTTGLTFTVGDGTADPTMTFTGTIANITTALNGMRFNPPNGFSGAASLTITTNDQGASGSGGALSDTDTVSITVGPAASADLAITMTDAPDPVLVGNNLTYSIVVRNNGPFQATTVTMGDILPGGVTLVSATPSQGSCSGMSLVRCDFGALNSGSTATVTIVVRPTQRGTITNRVGVGANQSDPNTANNTAVVQTRVN